MSRNLSWLPLVVGLAVCVGCATPPAKEGDAPEAVKEKVEPPKPLTPTDPFAIENLLPDTTIAYLSVDDVVGSIDALSETALGKMLADDEVKAFLAKPIAQYRDVMSQISAKTGFPEADLYAAFRGQVACALLDLEPAEARDPEVAVLVAARVTDAQAAGRLIRWVENSAKDDQSVTPFSRPGWQGITAPVDPGSGVEAIVALHEKIAIFSMATKGNAAFERFLKAVDGTVEKSLSDAGEYRNVLKKLGPERLMITYVDVDTLLQKVLALAEQKGAPNLQQAETVIAKLGLDRVTSYTSVLQVDGPGVTQKTFVGAPAPREGVFDLLPSEPLDAATANMVGTDPMVFLAGSFSFQELLKLVREVAGVFNARQQIDVGLAQIAGMTGIDFERELINQLDDDIAFMLFEPETTVDNPAIATASGAALVLQVKMTAPVSNVLVKIAGVLDMILKGQGRGSIQEETFMNAKLRYPQITGAPIAPCIVVVGDRLVIAGSADVAKNIVRHFVKPELPLFTERDEFKELLSHAGGEVGPSLIYADTKSSVTSTMSAAGDGLSLMMQNYGKMKARARARPSGGIDFGEPEDWVDLSKLPSSKAITTHVFPQVGTSAHDDDGLLSTTYGPLGPLGVQNMASTAGIAVIAAIAIPNLVQSRVASNETSAVASFMVVLAGQATFHKVDFYKKGALVYANKRDGAGIYDLYQLPNGTDVRLIDRSLAMAFKGQPKAGYLFADLTRDGEGAEYDPMIEFAMCAVPAAYESGGRNIFVMDTGGTLYQTYARTVFPTIQPGDRVPFLTKYPSAEELATKWIAIGSR